MGVTRWHIPAIRRPAALVGNQFVMVTACGKRGPLKPREDLGAFPVDLFDAQERAHFDALICPECLVAWDRAEEEGRLLHVWAMNMKREWHAHGAPLVITPPSRVVSCPRCRDDHDTFRWDPWKLQPLVVVVRDA